MSFLRRMMIGLGGGALTLALYPYIGWWGVGLAGLYGIVMAILWPAPSSPGQRERVP